MYTECIFLKKIILKNAIENYGFYNYTSRIKIQYNKNA